MSSSNSQVPTINQGTLTDSQQKEYSKISNAISNQKTIIVKELAIISEKGDTYLCLRARNTLESAKSKLENWEREYEQRREKLKNDIKQQESIIYQETHKKSPTIIRAEKEIELLQEKLQKFCGSAPEIQEEVPEASTSLQEEMLEELLKPIPEEFLNSKKSINTLEVLREKLKIQKQIEEEELPPPRPKKLVKSCAPRMPIEQKGPGISLYPTPVE